MKPHEDWVDGSWTVDCVCGVNFDDGKEMVNCDECGVWVHTWCSRYVKGDDLFACHKCKTKSNDNEASASAAAAAAKLLVTKTFRMESLSTTREHHTVPLNRGFRGIPIEERVHVQGVPGGDLALLERFSSVFSRQLWKCTGYVPKKFGFQCREFPWWDEKENVCGTRRQEDGCTGVLLSMSKENDVAAAARTNDKGINEEKLCRSLGARGMEMRQSEIDVNKEKRLLLCPLSTNKGRKEDCEDRVKKKVRVADKQEEDDDKNDSVGKTLFSPYNAIGRL